MARLASKGKGVILKKFSQVVFMNQGSNPADEWMGCFEGHCRLGGEY